MYLVTESTFKNAPAPHLTQILYVFPSLTIVCCIDFIRIRTYNIYILN